MNGRSRAWIPATQRGGRGSAGSRVEGALPMGGEQKSHKNTFSRKIGEITQKKNTEGGKGDNRQSWQTSLVGGSNSQGEKCEHKREGAGA